MTNVAIDREQLAAFCLHNHIVRLSLFGSVLRSDFNPDSDIDILVEFAPHHIPGLLGIARMERELSLIFGGRKVDLRTANDPDAGRVADPGSAGFQPARCRRSQEALRSNVLSRPQANDLSRYFRADVVREAELQYAQG
ncbi:MAG: nucleotidyltransferase [Chloroflexi bacterium CFX6]|nr:nucleotidyltransferase [Chloroflexi bacterium CFX6]